MKTKLLTIFSIILMLISIFTVEVFAKVTKVDFNLTADKGTYSAGDEVIVTLKFSNLDSESGLLAYSGNLEYDTEALTYTKKINCENWSTYSRCKQSFRKK